MVRAEGRKMEAVRGSAQASGNGNGRSAASRLGLVPAGIIALVVLEAILALLGFASGSSFVRDPSGADHGFDTQLLEAAPVDDFLVVGLFFVTCYGVLPFAAILGLWLRPRWKWTDFFNRWTGQNWAWSAAVATGVILIVWIVVEIYYIGSPEGIPRALQTMMATMGAVIVGLCLLPGVRKFTRLADVKAVA
jgi:hypothetical protein